MIHHDDAVPNHFAEIRDTTNFTVPAGPADEMAELYAAIMAESG